jgi:sulfate adenylyltransferase subunit 2/3'(2'), 5'-bisphosphate nucleotidase
MEVCRAGATAEWKEDGSPVTVADQRAEAIILEGLCKLAPGVPVVAEESVAAGRIPEIGAEFFLVDPLDGTKEFLRGADSRGEFTVNIALVRDRAPIAGVVLAPALSRLWVAGTERAWATNTVERGDGMEPLQPIHVRPAPDGGVRAIASRSNRNAETEAYLELYDVAEFREAGSSLKFCLLAEGKADLYPRLAPTMEWDTAAGDAILRAAGGRTVTLDGAPLAYGKRGRTGAADFANPGFVALGGVAFRRA